VEEIMMEQQLQLHVPSKKLVSLSVRISLLLVFTAIIPLVIAVAGSELLSRPQLVTQAATNMESDARTRMSLIDAYLIERIQGVETISKSNAIANYLTGNKASTQAASDNLTTGQTLDPNYDTWSILDATQGKMLLSYPTEPQMHGKYYVAPNILKQLQQTNKSLLSDVFFDATKLEATIDIYAPVYSSHLLGIVRATLNIYYIWDTVNRVASDRGDSSYASIVDENNVRVAYTTQQTNSTYNYSSTNNPSGYSRPAELFTAITPLPTQIQQQIRDLDLYGNDSKAVTVMPDASLAQMLHSSPSPATFALTPTDQKYSFQVASYKSTILPWTFLIFSPLSAITAIANQQLFYASMIALFVLILAALVGLGIGRRIAAPIMNSVLSLSSSSQALKTLALKEQITATEQRWMVESSQVGLQSVRYYTNAINIAANKLGDVSTQLTQHWRKMDDSTIESHLQEIGSAAQYIERAAVRQEESSKGLTTAIRVTTQVTEQLATGATSAADASQQLEQVVNQLRSVVGK
jgi:Fe-S cluster assembly scaffold protein SufB